MNKGLSRPGPRNSSGWAGRRPSAQRPPPAARARNHRADRRLQSPTVVQLEGMAMNDITAQASRTIKARPEEIWEALTRPEKLKQFFFGATVETDWRVGSPIRMKGDYQGRT